MPQFELIMPKMGESIMEATILKWLKNVGDKVQADESVLEIATDKVDSEVPSQVSGVITSILFKEGETVPVGKAIALITTDAPAAVRPAADTPAPVTAAPVSAMQSAAAAAPVPAPAGNGSYRSNGSGRFYSPLVISIAKREGVSMSELGAIAGTGQNNRVTKKDILAHVSGRKDAPSFQPLMTAPAAAPAPQQLQPAVSASGREEIIEMDRMRKLIAQHMVMSKQTSAHVTSFVEADVTNMVLWRNKIKDQFQAREGEKLTFTPLFIEVIVRAIKDFPLINSSVSGEQIILKKDIHIGVAAALPTGNLIVPVIRNADTKNLIGLTREVNDLSGRARQGKLKPQEIEGGTFTLSNVGTFGNAMGTPIIFQPQVAILATGAIKKKPAVIETPHGDLIGIRHMMFLSLSYDHRIIDGALGGSFVRRIADYLETFDLNRTI